MSSGRDAAKTMSKAEGDHFCRMVLAVVRSLAHERGLRPDPVRGVEPTGATVDPVMRPYVEQRNDEREAS